MTGPAALPVLRTPDPHRRSWVQQIMGMPMSVLVRGHSARTPQADAAVQRVFAELRRLDAVFSTYRPDSQISRLGRGELDLARADDEVREVLALCEDARQRTDGWFDHELPGPDGRRRLDPSGLVKSWAAERAARHLTALEDGDWLLNAGGDVVAHTAGDPFQVGIQAPTDPLAVLDVVPLACGGVATSGSYARGGHVIDPHTGQAAASLASVTVVGACLREADVLATACYAQGLPGLGRVERTPGYQALFVPADGSRRTTSGWPGSSSG